MTLPEPPPLCSGGDLSVEGRAILERAGLQVIETAPYLSHAAMCEAMRAQRPAGVIVRMIADVLDAAAMRAGGRLFDPNVPDSVFIDVARREANLDVLLANSDIVSLHCPLTPETRGLIDARRLGLMKPTAYLVNTARGEVVDQTALVSAMERGRLAGAGLDCFATEPPEPGNPLFRLPNTTVTPHGAGVTIDAKRAVSAQAAENVVAILGGSGRRSSPRPTSRRRGE